MHRSSGWPISSSEDPTLRNTTIRKRPKRINLGGSRAWRSGCARPTGGTSPASRSSSRAGPIEDDAEVVQARGQIVLGCGSSGWAATRRSADGESLLWARSVSARRSSLVLQDGDEIVGIRQLALVGGIGRLGHAAASARERWPVRRRRASSAAIVGWSSLSRCPSGRNIGPGRRAARDHRADCAGPVSRKLQCLSHV